jgi:selenide,water dikinase
VTHPNLLVGLERADDAGVYKLTEDIALVQSVDFFTPIVDDPYVFGQIAATNALSDVYAMGGTPITAMNLVAFPIGDMELDILRKTLRGGLEKLREAGVVLVGGHSIEDKEFKYGLSVTGIVHPEQVLTNTGAREEDKIILTKPLGTGIINTALKGDMASGEHVAKATEAMATLNRAPAEIMRSFRVHACTDVTGFGLLGHMSEMLGDGTVGIRVDTQAIPLFDGAIEYAQMGLVPGGTGRNKEFYRQHVDTEAEVTPYHLDVLFDAQTSGGLLIAVHGEDAVALLEALHAGGVSDAAIVAEVVNIPRGRLILA